MALNDENLARDALGLPLVSLTMPSFEHLKGT
jgi:hypothetical protein